MSSLGYGLGVNFQTQPSTGLVPSDLEQFVLDFPFSSNYSTAGNGSVDDIIEDLTLTSQDSGQGFGPLGIETGEVQGDTNERFWYNYRDGAVLKPYWDPENDNFGIMCIFRLTGTATVQAFQMHRTTGGVTWFMGPTVADSSRRLHLNHIGGTSPIDRTTSTWGAHADAMLAVWYEVEHLGGGLCNVYARVHGERYTIGESITDHTAAANYRILGVLCKIAGDNRFSTGRVARVSLADCSTSFPTDAELAALERDLVRTHTRGIGTPVSRIRTTIVSGQSNARGNNNTGLRTPDGNESDVLFCDGLNQGVDASDNNGVGGILRESYVTTGGTAYWAFEQKLATEMATALGNYNIIKHADNGKAFALPNDPLHPDIAAQGTSWALLESLRAKADMEYLGLGQEPDYECFAWFQGESEQASASSAGADSYFSTLGKMFDRVETITGTSDIKFVMVLPWSTTEDVIGTLDPHFHTVRAAIVARTLEDANRRWLDSKDSARIDTVHLSAAAMDELGEDIADNLKDWSGTAHPEHGLIQYGIKFLVHPESNGGIPTGGGNATWYDGSGNGNHLEMENDPIFAFQDGYFFDDASQHRGQSGGNVQLTGDFIIGLRIRPSNFSSTQHVLTIGTAVRILSSTGGDGLLRAQINDGSTTQIIDGALSVATEHTVMLRRTGDLFEVFRDSTTAGASGTSSPTVNAILRVADRSSETGTQEFHGGIRGCVIVEDSSDAALSAVKDVCDAWT